MKPAVVLYAIGGVVFCLTSVNCMGQRPAQQGSPASPLDVCSFITSRMTAAVPQIPTLCSGEVVDPIDPHYYDIHIYTPTDALESKSRRAWSSALFQTLEQVTTAESLHGACGTNPICDVTFADTEMGEHALKFETFISQDILKSLKNEMEAIGASEFSEQWYLAWWGTFLDLKNADHARSADNAKSLGTSACARYTEAVKARFEAFHKPVPACSVMLGTDKHIFIVLDFSELAQAIVANNAGDLPGTLGKYLDDTAYDGEVILRSPWTYGDKGTFRVYREYPLRWIEFAYEEVRSGTRSEADAEMLLISNYEGDGQTNADTLQDKDTSEVKIRCPVVVRTAPDGSGGMFLYTTDGSEWRIPVTDFANCGVGVGTKLDVAIIPGQKPSFVSRKDGKPCRMLAQFVKGW